MEAEVQGDARLPLHEELHLLALHKELHLFRGGLQDPFSLKRLERLGHGDIRQQQFLATVHDPVAALR